MAEPGATALSPPRSILAIQRLGVEIEVTTFVFG